MRRPNYMIVRELTTCNQITIRDIGPWDQHPTVTSAADAVVAALAAAGELPTGRRLFYYDSDGYLDEILHDGAGRFRGFRFLPPHELNALGPSEEVEPGEPPALVRGEAIPPSMTVARWHQMYEDECRRADPEAFRPRPYNR